MQVRALFCCQTLRQLLVTLYKLSDVLNERDSDNIGRALPAATRVGGGAPPLQTVCLLPFFSASRNRNVKERPLGLPAQAKRLAGLANRR